MRLKNLQKVVPASLNAGGADVGMTDVVIKEVAAVVKEAASLGIIAVEGEFSKPLSPRLQQHITLAEKDIAEAFEQALNKDSPAYKQAKGIIIREGMISEKQPEVVVGKGKEKMGESPIKQAPPLDTFSINSMIKFLELQIKKRCEFFDDWCTRRKSEKLSNFLFVGKRSREGICEQENLCLSWAETENIQVAFERREFILLKLVEGFLTKQLQQKLECVAPDHEKLEINPDITRHLEIMLEEATNKVSTMRDSLVDHKEPEEATHEDMDFLKINFTNLCQAFHQSMPVDLQLSPSTHSSKKEDSGSPPRENPVLDSLETPVFIPKDTGYISDDNLITSTICRDVNKLEESVPIHISSSVSEGAEKVNRDEISEEIKDVAVLNKQAENVDQAERDQRAQTDVEDLRNEEERSLQIQSRAAEDEVILTKVNSQPDGF